MKNLKELTREELELVLLDGKFVDFGLEVGNPKVFYTILNRIERINKIKL